MPQSSMSRRYASTLNAAASNWIASTPSTCRSRASRGGRDVEGESPPVPVVRVRHRVHEGHRPRQRPLEPARRAGPDERRLGGMDRLRPRQLRLGDWRGPRGFRCAWRAASIPSRRSAKPWTKWRRRLLPVRHHVDCLLLVAEREEHRVSLPLDECLGREPPARPAASPEPPATPAWEGCPRWSSPAASSTWTTAQGVGRISALGGARGGLGTLIAGGPREHRGNDPAAEGLVDRRREVARMSWAGAPAVGLSSSM